MGKVVKLELPPSRHRVNGARHAQGWAQLQARDRRVARHKFWRNVGKGVALALVFGFFAWLTGRAWR